MPIRQQAINQLHNAESQMERKMTLIRPARFSWVTELVLTSRRRGQLWLSAVNFSAIQSHRAFHIDLWLATGPFNRLLSDLPTLRPSDEKRFSCTSTPSDRRSAGLFPSCRHPCSHLSSEGTGVPGALGRACKSTVSGCSRRNSVPLGIGSCARQNQTSICSLGLRRAFTED